VVETALVVYVATKYSSQTFFMDGTFSVAPHPCKQLYTIQVPFKDVAVTAVYAFLPKKCQDTYRELFQSIVANCHASILQLNVQTRRCCREAPNQAAVSFAMMLVSVGRNSPGGLCGDQIQL
jgi:hypothetical protein